MQEDSTDHAAPPISLDCDSPAKPLPSPFEGSRCRWTGSPSLGARSAAGQAALDLLTASGVPLQCDEGADFRTFRIGLFGLDKLGQTERAVKSLEQALEQALGKIAQSRAQASLPAMAAMAAMAA